MPKDNYKTIKDKASKNIHQKGEGGACKVQESARNKRFHCQVGQEKDVCVHIVLN